MPTPPLREAPAVGRYAPPAPPAPAAGAASAPPLPSTSAAPAARLPSLDVFRGATVAAMILVNNPGSWELAYAPLRPVTWTGWGLTETIAPAFLWIVGVAIALGAPAAADGAPVRHRPFGRVVRRAALLFALGLLIAATPRVVPLLDLSALATLRIPGTMQRIALCYLAASAIARWSGPRGVAAWAVGLLAGYWALMLLVPVPGWGAGSLEPGRNLAVWVDRAVLGPHAKAQDPLGILSTLPAIATTLLGVLAGLHLRRPAAPLARTAALFAAGNVLVVAGAVLAWWIPVSEGLWTPSFTVLTAGIATSAFALCHWLVEVRGGGRWTVPLTAFGRNALAMFVLSQMLAAAIAGVGVAAFGRPHVSLRGLLFEGVFLRLPLASPAFASLLYALAWVAAFGALALLLHRKHWIIKV